MPRPRALGSTRSRRSLATASVFLTQKTEPTFSPSSSAIQQRSRFGSWWPMNLATMSDQRLELLAPAVFPGVQRAVALNDPAHVAGSGAPQHVGSSVLGPGPEQPLDGVHRRHQALLLRLRQRPQQGADVVV